MEHLDIPDNPFFKAVQAILPLLLAMRYYFLITHVIFAPNCFEKLILNYNFDSLLDTNFKSRYRTPSQVNY